MVKSDVSLRAASRLEEIASQTEGFSGADLVGILNSATSFAMDRCMDSNDWSKMPNISALEIKFADLEKGLKEIKAAKGLDLTDM